MLSYNLQNAFVGQLLNITHPITLNNNCTSVIPLRWHVGQGTWGNPGDPCCTIGIDRAVAGVPTAFADRYSNVVPVSFSETLQSLLAVAGFFACGMIRARAGAPRNSPIPPGP